MRCSGPFNKKNGRTNSTMPLPIAVSLRVLSTCKKPCRARASSLARLIAASPISQLRPAWPPSSPRPASVSEGAERRQALRCPSPPNSPARARSLRAQRNGAKSGAASPAGGGSMAKPAMRAAGRGSSSAGRFQTDRNFLPPSLPPSPPSCDAGWHELCPPTPLAALMEAAAGRG